VLTRPSLQAFRRLMGTTCDLVWRETGEDEELIWTVAPAHRSPTASSSRSCSGATRCTASRSTFPCPTRSSSSALHGREVFRSGCCFLRGAGRIFYFSPGTRATRGRAPAGRRVIGNAVDLAKAPRRRSVDRGPRGRGRSPCGRDEAGAHLRRRRGGRRTGASCLDGSRASMYIDVATLPHRVRHPRRRAPMERRES